MNVRTGKALAGSLLSSLVVAGSVLCAASAHAAPVDFADPEFRACVNDALGQVPTAPIEDSQAAAITSLSCGNFMGITNLEGSQSLTSLNLADNAVVDLSPISALVEQILRNPDGFFDASDQRVVLPATTVGATVSSPVVGPDSGAAVGVTSSDPLVSVAADGLSWTALATGTATLDWGWVVPESWGSWAGYSAFSGVLTQAIEAGPAPQLTPTPEPTVVPPSVPTSTPALANTGGNGDVVFWGALIGLFLIVCGSVALRTRRIQ